ncbi:hypothetical protein GC176_23190 [bacterium]|nr:hypothetical protein [bacterium]
MNRAFQLCLLTSLTLLTAVPTLAQDQFFPGAPQSNGVFNPLAGRQPVPPQPVYGTNQPGVGVWHYQTPLALQNPRIPATQTPSQTGPWLQPSSGPLSGQVVPGTVIDPRTRLPIQSAAGQPTLQSQPAAQQAVRNAASLYQPSPYQSWQQQNAAAFQTPQARRFWHDIRGYGESYYGQSRAGISSYGQNRFNQNRLGYSRYNQSRSGQSYPQPSLYNQNRYNQNRLNMSLHNVIVPYGQGWR